MRITKVYTRTGDKGKTRLAGGQQVWKNSLRVEAYGTVDELNSVIGLVCAMSHNVHAAEEFQEDLYWIQNKLFDLGGLLATAKGQVFKNMPRISSSDTLRLERLIDKCQSDLQPTDAAFQPGSSGTCMQGLAAAFPGTFHSPSGDAWICRSQNVAGTE